MQQGNIRKALDNLDNAGYRLRCAREYMGLSEKQVADELKLMVAHIRAIEQNRSEYLVQRKPFERYLRAYARLVQLNPDTIVDMYFAGSEQQTGQPVDIATRREIPAQPVVTLQAAGGWRSLQNLSPVGVFSVGLLAIGVSLAAGWGVKQLVGGSPSQVPLVQQNDVGPQRYAGSDRQPPAAVELPELAEIRFAKPVSAIPPVSESQAQRDYPAAQASDAAVASLPPGDEPAITSTSPSPAAGSGEDTVPKIKLQRFTVQAKKRPVAILAEVTPPAVEKKPEIVVAEKVQKPPVAEAAKTAGIKKADDPPGNPADPQGAAAKRIAKASPATQTQGEVAADAEATARSVQPAVADSTVQAAIKPVTAAGEQPGGQIGGDNTTKPAAVKKATAVPALQVAAAAATTQSPAVVLQRVTVKAKQRPVIAAPAPSEHPAPEAEDLQQILASDDAVADSSNRTNPGAGDSSGFGPELQDEATDLEAVIDAANQPAEQPFEMALANSSDSASVARLALLESYKSTLRKRVYENVKYPSRASRRNLQGKVVMNATVSRSGELLSFELAEASKYKSLNRASEKAIKEANPFPAAPDTLSGDSFILTVPVVFKAAESPRRWR